jgi:hypothetical protein
MQKITIKVRQVAKSTPAAVPVVKQNPNLLADLEKEKQKLRKVRL